MQSFSVASDQPVVVLGGFLITDEAYLPLASWIESRCAAPVRIVHATRADWLLTSQARGWIRLLDRVDRCVKQLASSSSSGRVTLIGHSSGGVMLRPYLSDRPFLYRRYGGKALCNRLITLGSPHQAKRATALRMLVDQTFPGCPEASSVDYVAVAGELDLSGPCASWFSRITASNSYRQIAGDASVPGDGLVPVTSALLADARSVRLKDTAHGGLFGSPWYGSTQTIPTWWSAVVEGASHR